MSFVDVSIAITDCRNELCVSKAPEFHQWDYLRSESRQQKFDGLVNHMLNALVKVPSIISIDSRTFDEMKAHQWTEVGHMTSQLWTTELLNCLSKDFKANNLDMQFGHLYDIESQIFVGNLLLGSFWVLNLVNGLVDEDATEDSKAFVNCIDIGEVFWGGCGAFNSRDCLKFIQIWEVALDCFSFVDFFDQFLQEFCTLLSHDSVVTFKCWLGRILVDNLDQSTPSSEASASNGLSDLQDSIHGDLSKNRFHSWSVVMHLV